MSATRHYPTSRAFPIFIGLSLVLLGSLFLWLMARSFLRALDMRRHWQETPCVILVSEIEERVIDPTSPPEYHASLTYGYEWNGEPRTGTNITLRGNPWSSDPGTIGKQLAGYPVSSRQTCLVNPADPGIAVLKPDSLAPGYSLWFPALFVLGGAGIVINTARKGKKS